MDGLGSVTVATHQFFYSMMLLHVIISIKKKKNLQNLSFFVDNKLY